MMSKTLYKYTQYITCSITLCIVSLLTYVSIAADIGIDTDLVEKISNWPASTLIGSIALAAIWTGYKAWCKIFEIVKEKAEFENKLLKELADRPCFSNKVIDEMNKRLEQLFDQLEEK